MNSEYSESLVSDDNSESSMETHAEDDSSITTEERDENSLKKNKAASQLKTVLMRKSIPGLH